MFFSFYICKILDDLSFGKIFVIFFGHYDIFWAEKNSSDSL